MKRFLLGLFVFSITGFSFSLQAQSKIPCFAVKNTGGKLPQLVNGCGGSGGGQVSISINGPTCIDIGNNSSYSINKSGSGSHTSTTYYITGGSIVSQSKTQVVVNWTSSGTKSVGASARISGQNYLTFLGVNSKPDKPLPIALISQNCGSADIYKSDVPESNTWYWQGTNQYGKSTDDNSISYRVTSNGRYYLRAYNSSTNCWSQSRSVDVVIDDGPEAPTLSSITYDFNGATATRNEPPAGETWFWHTSATSTIQSNSSLSYLMTEDKTYYLRGMSENDCWGENLVIEYLAQEPQVISATTASHNSINVSWSGVRGNETGFLISRSDQPDGTYTAIHTAGPNDMEYTDTNLAINSTWYYRVQALVNEQKSTGLQIVSAFTSRLTRIPDPNFQWHLKYRYPYIRDIEGYVYTSDIEQITELSLGAVVLSANDTQPRNMINSLEGIEEFSDLERLTIWKHEISTLDLSSNEYLTSFTYLDAKAIADPHPDVPALLSCVQISQSTLGNPSFELNVPYYLSVSTDCDNLPRTAIPDGGFENYLIDQGWDNIRDGFVNTDIIASVEELVISGYHYIVGDLSGIEDFSALRELDYNGYFGTLNQAPDLSFNSNLEHIELTNHPNLECIKVSQSQIEDPSITWSISSYIGITTQDCELINIDDTPLQSPLHRDGYLSAHNDENISRALMESITEFDLSGVSIPDTDILTNLKGIEILNLAGCGLTDERLSFLLDLSNLRVLQLNDNNDYNLTSVDVSSLTRLEHLVTTGNRSLRCIQVSNDQQSDPNLIIEKDTYTGLSLDCLNQELTYIPSADFEAALIELGWDNIGDGYIVTDVIEDIHILDLREIDWTIYSIEGIQDFKAVEEIYLSRHNISFLDLSNNLNLNRVSTFENPNLTCINVNVNQIDEVDWYKDSFTGLSVEPCQNVYIPDDNFEQYLIDEGYDNKLDDYVSISTIQNKDKLLISSKGINSLVGIEHFKALNTLFAGDNNLTSLDLSGNTMLEVVQVHFNDLDCIQVNEDQLTNRVSSWAKDSEATWSLDCSSHAPDMMSKVSPATGIEVGSEVDEKVLNEVDSPIQLTLYPNPAHAEVHLIGNIENALINLYDLNGKLVMSQSNDGDSSFEFNSENLNSGIYMIRITLESGETQLHKLVIQH